MSGISLATATERLQQYLDAEAKVLTGQQYSIGDRSLTRANIAQIREGIKYWDAQVKRLSAANSGRGRSLTIRPNW
jgi:hypothetical protein